MLLNLDDLEESWIEVNRKMVIPFGTKTEYFLQFLVSKTNPFLNGKPQIHTSIIYSHVQRLHLLKKYGSVFHKNHLASNLDA